LQKKLSAERWQTVVFEALEQVALIQEVEAALGHCRSLRQAHDEVAPEVPWGTFERWRIRLAQGEGPEWERMLDARVTPEPWRLPPDICLAAVVVRRVSPQATCDEAREILFAQFGEVGRISDSSLGRIWRAAGLTGVKRGRGSAPDGKLIEEVQRRVFHGGGGLAFVGVAETEFGGPMELAAAILESGHQVASDSYGKGFTGPDPVPGRDDHGHLTAAYNKALRADVASGERDSRWDADTVKRSRRDVNRIRFLDHSERILADKILAIGVTPWLTELRGLGGLAGPQGAYLEILGGTPYQPSTLKKFLGEAGVMGVDDAVWDAYARWKTNLEKDWFAGASSWKQVVYYVDGTQEPYWTQQYAKSGKVSSTGTVMPCLTRVAVCTGAGAPLLLETFPGTVSLKTQLVPTLKRLENVLGTQVGGLTIIDSEMCSAKTLSALLALNPSRKFITVLKGPALKKDSVIPEGDVVPYRQKDQLQEGQVILRGKGAPRTGLKLRAVSMTRPESRRPKPTVFVTNATPDDLSTGEVADAYLSRWPQQEQKFREQRNGGGLNHTHGYGGSLVQHVKLDTRREGYERSVVRAEARLKGAQELMDSLPKDAPSSIVAAAGREKKAANKQLTAAQLELKKASTTPTLIYERDTTRENIATAAHLVVLMLLEAVFRHYFRTTSMSIRTFIDHFMHLPVTSVTTRHSITYEITENPRSPRHMRMLRQACIEVTKRKLQRDGRRIVFKTVGSAGPK
jgi:hypothetical protein